MIMPLMMVSIENPFPLDDRQPVLTKSAAFKFVESYHNALQSDRGAIESFYSPSPVLLMNGIPCNAQTFMRELVVDVPSVNFKVDSIDCQTLLPSSSNNHVYDRTVGNQIRNPSSMMVLVTVSGDFSYSMDSTVLTRGFSESFVLANDRYGKWTISVQVLRFVAWLTESIRSDVRGSSSVQRIEISPLEWTIPSAGERRCPLCHPGRFLVTKCPCDAHFVQIDFLLWNAYTSDGSPNSQAKMKIVVNYLLLPFTYIWTVLEVEDLANIPSAVIPSRCEK